MPQSLSQGSFIKIHTTRRGNKEEERIEEEEDNKISSNLSRLEKYQEKLEGKKIERESERKRSFHYRPTSPSKEDGKRLNQVFDQAW